MKLYIVLIIILFPLNAWATSTGMPWEGPMNQILNSLTGPWLRFGSVVSIMSAGLALALGETSGFLKKMIMLVLGLSIACAASGWGLSFFGFAGGFNF